MTTVAQRADDVLLRLPTSYGQVVARSLGAGPLVLALHGGLGLAHDYLVPGLAPLAEAGYRIVLPDLPGNGRSRPVPAYPDMDGYADVCVELLDLLGVDRAVLLGHSYGGFIALQAALAHPARVAGLVLVGSSAAMDHWSAIHAALDARTDLGPDVLRGFRGEPFRDSDDYAAWLALALPLYLPAGADPAVVTPLPLDQVDLAVMQHGAAVMARWDVRPRLPEVQCPALVVTGRDDVLMAAAHDALVRGLPRAAAWCPASTGHFPFDERRAEFTSTVLGWLRDEAGW